MDIFSFSEDWIKKTNRCLLEVLFVGVFFGFCFVLIISDFNLRVSSICTSLVFLIYGAFIFIKVRQDNARQRQTKVFTDNDRIILKGGKTEMCFFWEDIVKVRVIEDVKGNIWTIKLFGRDRKTIYLHGFDGMEKIVGLLKGKISETISVQTKRHRLNWQSSVVRMPVYTITGAMICLFFILVGEYFWGPFSEIANEYMIHPLVKFIFGLLGFDV